MCNKGTFAQSSTSEIARYKLAGNEDANDLWPTAFHCVQSTVRSIDTDNAKSDTVLSAHGHGGAQDGE